MKALLFVALLLAGCASHVAEDAKTSLLGSSRLELESCAGLPAREALVDGEVELLQFDLLPEKAGSGFSMKVLTYLDLNFTPAGTCMAIVRMDDGVVAGVAYPGDATSMFGRYDVCAPIFEECVHSPVHIPASSHKKPHFGALKAITKD